MQHSVEYRRHDLYFDILTNVWMTPLHLGSTWALQTSMPTRTQRHRRSVAVAACNRFHKPIFYSGSPSVALRHPRVFSHVSAVHINTWPHPMMRRIALIVCRQPKLLPVQQAYGPCKPLSQPPATLAAAGNAPEPSPDCMPAR